jgi:hypothetical protein
MLPIFDPALTMFEPVVLRILAAVAAAGMAVVVGLVVLANRRPARPCARVSPLRRRRLPEAA